MSLAGLGGPRENYARRHGRKIFNMAERTNQVEVLRIQPTNLSQSNIALGCVSDAPWEDMISITPVFHVGSQQMTLITYRCLEDDWAQ